MNARYENDPARPGHGVLVVSDVETTDSQNIRYTLQRARDHKSLHPHGWEDSACALEPDAVTVENNALRLSVGPNVVAQLDELDTYRFLVHAAGGTRRATLELAGIVYPSRAGSGNVAAPEAIRTPPPVAEPAAMQESRPPEEEKEAAPASPPERLELDPAGSPTPTEATANAARPRHPRILLAALLVALLAIAGGAALWRFMQDNAPENAPIADPDASAPEPRPDDRAESPNRAVGPAETPQKDLPAGEASPKPSHASEGRTESPRTDPARTEPEQPLRPLDQARALLRGGASPEQALDLARRLANSAEADATAGDAAFLLFETAAEGGQPEAMLRLGGFYDPAETAPRGSILPDAEQAWFWYGKAHEAGLGEAAQRKAVLRARLEKEAASGSTEARALLERLH